MSSLSRHRDVPQQWAEYGHAGRGFAIGFAPKLRQPCGRLLGQPRERQHSARGGRSVS